MPQRILSAPEQVAACLRDELLRGRWSGALPGIHRLSADLGFPRKHVERALLLLEKEGLLIPQGAGRKRLIRLPDGPAKRPLNVAVLDYDRYGLQEAFMVELIHRLNHRGHTARLCDKTLMELGFNAARIARLVEQTAADAWIVRSAPAPVLQWFLKKQIPVFSIFGNFIHLPVAGIGVDYLAPMKQILHQLMDLGHRRIVLICASGEASPTGFWAELLQQLESRGTPTGSYNLPRWENTRDGFHRMLSSLFEHTPPTALIIEEPIHVIPVLQFCAHHGIRIPQELSLVCMQAGPQFDYCHLPITTIDWSYQPITRRVDRWISQVASGKTDLKHEFCEAVLVSGGTVAAAPA